MMTSRRVASGRRCRAAVPSNPDPTQSQSHNPAADYWPRQRLGPPLRGPVLIDIAWMRALMLRTPVDRAALLPFGRNQMMRKYFGTDGIRGSANTEPVTPGTVLRLAMAAGELFRRGEHRHRAVIGKDTRLSGYMLEPALVSGFIAMGMDVMLVGPMPTPAVAMLTRSLRADVGVMISASHNPYQDNGIKLFGPDGYKLSDDEEDGNRIVDGFERL